MKKIACAVVVVLGIASQAHASITFDATWSGASFGNGAVAQGLITVDNTAIPNPGSYLSSSSLPAWLLGVTITVTGASSGNGTFTLSDFTGMFWDTGGATLDLNAPLIGQAGWGPGGVGDFNFFSLDGAPHGVDPFTFLTASTTAPGSDLLLTSLTATPEPASVSLFVLGAAALAVVRRRARRAS